MLSRELYFAMLGTGATCLATVLGAGTVFLFKKDMGAGLQRAFLGFAAGVMIAASVWSLLIPAMEMAEEQGQSALLAAGGGALAWAVYLACTCNGLDIFAGLFFATLAAALASELLARAVKAPVIMLLVPMLIPLIPGGDLYYMMSFLVRGQYEAFGQYAQRVLTEAGAIALGIICVASLMNIITGLRVRARGGK